MEIKNNNVLYFYNGGFITFKDYLLHLIYKKQTLTTFLTETKKYSF